MKRWVLVLGLGCAGHSAPSIPPDTAHSGSRLKLAWYELADGLRTWASPSDLYDAQLGFSCAPAVWADGITRCTPDPVQLFFLDPACTQPVLGEEGIGVDAAPGCMGIYATGGPLPTGPLYVSSGQTIEVHSLFARDPAGACDGVLIGPQPTAVVYTVGRTIPQSRLATTTMSLAGTGDVAIATMQSADGLLVPVQPYDTRYGVSCSLEPLASATAAPCTPVEALTSDVFADASCNQPAVRVGPGCKVPPLAAMRTLGCPQYFEVADHPVAGALTEQYFGDCVPNMMGSDDTGYPLGAPADELWLSRAPEPSALREQVIYVSAGAVRVRDAGRLYDTMLGTECAFDRVADGATATCLPTAHASIESFVYSDSSCTQMLPYLVDVSDNDGCTVRMPSTIVGAGTTFNRIGALHTGPVYQDLGGCSLYPYGSSARLYELGEAVSVTQLPTAVKRRDP